MRTHKTCYECKRKLPVDNFATPQMRCCLTCQAAVKANTHPENITGRTIHSTPEGRAAIMRERRRDAAYAKQVKADPPAKPRRGRPAEFKLKNVNPNDPLLKIIDVNKPRKCRRCQARKPQREFHPHSYVCFACDKAALEGTKPLGPPRGRNGGRRWDALKQDD